MSIKLNNLLKLKIYESIVFLVTYSIINFSPKKSGVYIKKFLTNASQNCFKIKSI